MKKLTMIAIALLAAGCGTESKPDTTGPGNNSQPDMTSSSNDPGVDARGSSRYSFALLSQGESLEVADFEPAFDEAMCSQDCEANTAPTLGAPVFVVNGEVTESLNATTADDVVIFVPFSDAECNLSCGMRSDSFQEPQGGGDAASSLPTNLPCSTDESDVYLRVTPASLPLDPGQYRYTLWVEDGCGARSANSPVEFELE